MLIKNSKVLIINGNWLNPVETPPPPEPIGEWKNITPSSLEAHNIDRNWEGASWEYNYATETLNGTWDIASATDVWFRGVDRKEWRGYPDRQRVYGKGYYTYMLNNERTYNDYLLIDFLSMYYCECSRASDYYYPSEGYLNSLFGINITYSTTSTTGLSPIGKTQNDADVITITNASDSTKSFQVKIGTPETVGQCACISNIKILLDLNNHKTYALCRPVPLTQTYDPTNFTNLKWHLMSDNNGFGKEILYGNTRVYIDTKVDRYDRSPTAGDTKWIETGITLTRYIPHWGYHGEPLNIVIDNESYHDYT